MRNALRVRTPGSLAPGVVDFAFDLVGRRRPVLRSLLRAGFVTSATQTGKPDRRIERHGPNSSLGSPAFSGLTPHYRATQITFSNWHFKVNGYA
ncbi:MAG: hypothetical protein ACJ74Z_10865 [Bryobacteraceae bacterium]